MQFRAVYPKLTMSNICKSAMRGAATKFFLFPIIFGLECCCCCVGLPGGGCRLTGPPHCWTEDGLLSLCISAGLPHHLYTTVPSLCWLNDNCPCTDGKQLGEKLKCQSILLDGVVSLSLHLKRKLKHRSENS